MSIHRTNLYNGTFDYSKLENMLNGHIVLTTSATTSIYLILKALNITGNVIIPEYGHPATKNVCYNLGIQTKIVKSNNLLMDCNDAISKIDDNTQCIVYIENNGFIDSDIFKLRKICTERGIFLLEDSAPSLGQSINSINAGSIGDASVISFSNSKIINLGGGGLCSIKDEDLYKKVKKLSKIMDYHDFEQGTMSNYMPECMYQILSEELKELDNKIQKRKDIFNLYFSEIGKYMYNTDSDKCYNACTLMLNETQMKKLTKVFNNFKIEYRNNVYPGNDIIAKKHIDIPFHTDISEKEVKLVSKLVKNALS